MTPHFIALASCPIREVNMSRPLIILDPSIWLGLILLSSMADAMAGSSTNKINLPTRTFTAGGTVVELKPDARTIVIRHEAISNYMAAMTMPFKVQAPHELSGLHEGDTISFQLHVTQTESWVDQIHKTGFATSPIKPAAKTAAPPVASKHPLLGCIFINELGHAVSLDEFQGQALAITFIYTRCPLPEYCPRLSKNFQEASQKLAAMTNAPANWHFLSVSFDPEFDSPAMLKAYGESYGYNPAHWSFLTGSAEKLGELARACGVTYEPDAGAINHNFRTLIIDAAGHLQMVFPTSGDLSDAIVTEMLKAAAATNQAVLQDQSGYN